MMSPPTGIWVAGRPLGNLAGGWQAPWEPCRWIWSAPRGLPVDSAYVVARLKILGGSNGLETVYMKLFVNQRALMVYEAVAAHAKHIVSCITVYGASGSILPAHTLLGTSGPA